MKLFKFQEQIKTEIQEGFKTRRVQCLASYTGSGKTNILVELCRDLIRDNPQVKIGISAYITEEIKEQIYERLCEFGLKKETQQIDAITRPSLKKNIFVFLPQSIFRKDFKLDFDYFCVDESHVGLSESSTMIRKIINHRCTKETKILLLSATPWDVVAMKDFADAKIIKRSLDKGFGDGLVTDFKFHAEEAKITFKESDFTRIGDLGKTAIERQMAIFKSACIGKFQYLRDNYDKELDKKCLVICPPGSVGEIAKALALEVPNGLAYTQIVHGTMKSGIEKSDTTMNLERFKNDPSIRFLFVINKCGVGFDMVDLNSVVDLTMTRNIKLLAQRCGRIARKNGKQKKHYFYVYDQSLMKGRLEWLVTTMIDFCLGHYDGWTTKTAKYRKTLVGGSQWRYSHPITVRLSDVVKALRSDLIENQITLEYLKDSGPPTKWNLTKAKEEALKFSSRTEMWKAKPALYKWFRINAKNEMDAIFPLINKIGKWNLKTVTEIVLKAKEDGLSRKRFDTKYSGAADWMERHKRKDILNNLIKPMFEDQRNEKKILKKMREQTNWAMFREDRHWMRINGGVKKWKQIFKQIHEKNKEEEQLKYVMRRLAVAKSWKYMQPHYYWMKHHGGLDMWRKKYIEIRNQKKEVRSQSDEQQDLAV